MNLPQSPQVSLTLTRCTIPCACHSKRHLNVQKWLVPLSFCTFDFDMSFAPQRPALFPYLNFQKSSDDEVFSAFSLGNASRDSGVPFFDMSTSKNGPSMVCFGHFDFQMCFPPERKNGLQFLCYFHLARENSASRHFYFFAYLHLLSLALSLLFLFLFLFHFLFLFSSLLLYSSHLCF